MRPAPAGLITASIVPSNSNLIFVKRIIIMMGRYSIQQRINPNNYHYY